MSRKYWIVPGLLAIPAIVLSLGLQIASAQQTQPAPAATPVITQVRIFNANLPADGAGSSGIGIQINAKVNGTCFATSIADSGRPDAYRCTVGNSIMDPCFGYYAAQSTLFCADVPWKAAVTPLAVSGTVQAIPPNKTPQSDLLKTLPWALELANGSRCALITGATGAFAGMRLNYGCEDKGYVIGDPIRDSQTWRVFYQGPKSFFAELTDVKVAWY
ncbi:MAG TPA: hypothetical protein VKQ72_06885 [Aggregatilineales bacterium]|nr:hypothetical protein [Aggregatilineales bacterium]